LFEKPEVRPRLKWDDNIQVKLKVDSRAWASFVWFRIREKRKAGPCECINEPSVCITCREFHNLLRN
jgi:hypothetical protein